MIEFKNVSCGYRGREVVQNASFKVRKGAITAVIGRNGQGKTTLISCLNGGVKYRGSILLEGKEVSKTDANERAGKIAFLPQFLKNTSFKVRELTEIGRRPYLARLKGLTEEDKEIIENAMGLAGVLDLADRKVNELSGGEKQRAYLSMILAQNTDVIVLDEALTHLDASNENEFFELFKHLTKSMGKTVLIVMHDLTKCINNADYIVVVDDGRAYHEKTAEEIMRTDMIENIFHVKKAKVYDEDGKEMVLYI